MVLELQMTNYTIIYKPVGDCAILIEWPQKIDKHILNDLSGFSQKISSFLDDGWELVPAYNSIMLISNSAITNFEELSTQLMALYHKKESLELEIRTQWQLPVYYDDEYALDLAEVARVNNITTSEVIALHTDAVYTVYAIGFLPGFMYLGGLDEKIVTPRKKQPRLKVEKGAVGIANDQTGVYPQESPGGWNIIGNCPIPIFDISASKPCFINVGDEIVFKEVSKPQFELYKIEVATGVYQPQKKTL